MLELMDCNSYTEKVKFSCFTAVYCLLCFLVVRHLVVNNQFLRQTPYSGGIEL